MAENKSNGTPKVSEPHKSKIVLWALIVSGAVLLIIVIAFSFSSEKSKTDQKTEQATSNLIREPIHPDDWFEWIQLPPNHSFKVESSGKWLAVRLWNGEEWDSRCSHCGAVFWRKGTIPNNTLQIKGDGGEAVITLEPVQ